MKDFTKAPKLNYLIIQACITAGMVGFGCLVFFELPPVLLPKLFNEKNRCFHAKLYEVSFYYISCPNNIYKSEPGLDSDQRGLVISFTDSIGGRISSERFPQRFNANNYSRFAIGDSFIQADEIPFEDTFYGISQEKNSQKESIYGLGMSSWNTQEYLKSMQLINKKDTKYDIYLFVNDFMPSDPTSTFSRTEFLRVEKLRRSSLTGFLRSELSRFLWNFRTFSRLRLFLHNKINPQLKPLHASPDKLNKFWEKYQSRDADHCMDISEVDKLFKSPTMSDLIMYTLPERCWTELAHSAYSYSMRDLILMKRLAKELRSDIRFILITPPWNFPNENIPGRFKGPYSIPSEISMPLVGLKNRLKADLGTSFVDLDSLIKDHVHHAKKSTHCTTESCDNMFYFGNDGHFNGSMHRLIHKVLY